VSAGGAAVVSRQWSPGEIDMMLQAAHARYEELLTDLDDLGKRAANAKSAFDRAHAEAMAKAVLEAKNAEERKSKATVATADVELTKFLAEHALDLAKRRVRAHDEQVGILRTLSASHRAVS
jgi:hypothetical protein